MVNTTELINMHRAGLLTEKGKDTLIEAMLQDLVKLSEEINRLKEKKDELKTTGQTN